MIYFDSDVLIHYLVVQDPQKHALATQLYEKAAKENRFFISLLSLQEVAFVLAKLKTPNDIITKKIAVFFSDRLVNYDLDLFKKACALAELIGFENTNDCLHTAIAETHCTELYTFNKSDFKRIQNHTTLKITIL